MHKYNIGDLPRPKMATHSTVFCWRLQINQLGPRAKAKQYAFTGSWHQTRQKGGQPENRTKGWQENIDEH